MKKIFIIFLLVIVALLAYIAFKPRVSPSLNQNIPSGHTTVNTNPNGSDYTPPVITFSGKAQVTDLVSFSITPGQEVSGVMNATGKIQGGYFFEANIVTNILDANKKILRAGHGTATTDWMTSDPVSFSTTLDFTGLPKGAAFVSIHNDNPSDLRENDKEIFIPIIIK